MHSQQDESIELDGTWRLVKVGTSAENVSSFCVNNSHRCRAIITASSFEGERIAEAARVAWGLAVHELAGDLGGGFLFFQKVRVENSSSSSTPQSWSHRFALYILFALCWQPCAFVFQGDEQPGSR